MRCEVTSRVFSVQSYKVYYTNNDTLPLSSWKSQTVQENKLTTISELVPHSIYTISVQAVTGMGPGPLSDPVKVKTQQGGKDCCWLSTALLGTMRDKRWNIF